MPGAIFSPATVVLTAYALLDRESIDNLRRSKAYQHALPHITALTAACLPPAALAAAAGLSSVTVAKKGTGKRGAKKNRRQTSLRFEQALFDRRSIPAYWPRHRWHSSSLNM